MFMRKLLLLLLLPVLAVLPLAAKTVTLPATTWDNVEGFDKWGTGYDTEHTVTIPEGTLKISAAHSTATTTGAIKDLPVMRKDATAIFTFSGDVRPTHITFKWKQWNKDVQTLNLSVSNNGTTFTNKSSISFASSTTNDVKTLEADITSDIQSVKVQGTKTGNSTRVGLVSIVLTYPDGGLGEIMYGENAAEGQVIPAEGGQKLTFTAENATLMSITVADHSELDAIADASTLEWTVPAATSVEQNFALKIEATDGNDSKEANVTVKVAAVDNRETLDLQFSAAEATAKMWALDEFVAPTLNNTEVEVAYSSSNTEVADFEEGILKIKAAGETDITATFAGNDTYKSATASYKLTVETLAKPEFSVSGSTLNLGETFTITCATEGAALSYTVNDGEAVEYTGAITAEEEGTFVYVATATLGTQTTTTQKTITVKGAPTFDFAANNYGMDLISDGGKYGDTPKSISSNGVTIEFNGKYRLWKGQSANDLRTYSGATMKFSVGAGLLISKIEFVASPNNSKFSFNGVTNKVYTPATPVAECTLTCSDTSYIGGIIVTVIAAAPEATVDGQGAGTTVSLDGKEKVEIVLTAAEGASIWYKMDYAEGNEPESEVARAHAGFTKAESNPYIVTLTKAGNFQYYSEFSGKESEIKAIEITGQTTGVEDVIVEQDQNTEYFDLTGRRVLNPASGLYIKVVGGKATKTYIR